MYSKGDILSNGYPVEDVVVLDVLENCYVVQKVHSKSLPPQLETKYTLGLKKYKAK